MTNLYRAADHRSPVVAQRDGDIVEVPNECVKCASRLFGFCTGLIPPVVARLKRYARTMTREAGTQIFADGALVTHIIVVRQGTARITTARKDGRRVVVDFVQPGDIIDPAADVTRSVGAEAVERTVLCSMPRGIVRELVAADIDLKNRFKAASRVYTSELEKRLLVLGRDTGRERMAGFLLGRARAQERMFGPPGAASFDIPFPMGRTDIADHLGLRAETISRLMADLRHDGIIGVVAHDRIRIMDIGRLTRAASE